MAYLLPPALSPGWFESPSNPVEMSLQWPNQLLHWMKCKMEAVFRFRKMSCPAIFLLIKKWAQKFEKFELPILFMSWQLQPLLLPLHWEDGHSCFLEFRREPTTKSSETEHFNLLAFCLDNGFLTMAYSPVALWPRQFVPGFLTAAICSLLAPYPPWHYIKTNIMFAVYLQHQNTGSNQFAITKLFAKSELVDHECCWKTFTLISGFISLYFCSWNWYGVVWYGGACIWLKVVWFLSNCFMAAAAFCFVWFASIRASVSNILLFLNWAQSGCWN